MKKKVEIKTKKRALLQVEEPLKKSVVIVYRNPDNIYLSSLKDVDVRLRKNSETLIYTSYLDKWISGPISNVDIQIDLDIINAGEY